MMLYFACVPSRDRGGTFLLNTGTQHNPEGHRNLKGFCMDGCDGYRD